MKNIPSIEEIPAYYRYIRPEIIEVIPAIVVNILDVGCGAGILGKILKEKTPISG
jgi:2-polyprenyl-3-methyl-5-hydroxy-6-metoxy-1,4-benzoquinol methylase